MDKYTPYQIVAYFISRLMNISDASQQEELQKWLKTSDEHRTLEHRLAQPETYKHYQSLCAEHDDQEAYRKFLRQIHRGKRLVSYRRLGYAAAIILPLAVALCLFYNPFERDGKTDLCQNAMIHPGSACAILILPDGKTIHLDTLSQQSQNIKSGITTINHILEYQNEEVVVEADHILTIPRGAEYSLKLSDGTRVWLNSETELQYPPVFSSDKRQVKLKGEAYFEVAKDVTMPFIVEAGGQSITVLGTSFCVRAYADEERIQTTLETGSVRVTTGADNMLLCPGEQANLDVITLRLTRQKVNTELYTAWHLGKFIFNDQPLEEILTILSRWYGINIYYATSDLKGLKFTGELKRYGEIREFLEKIQYLEKVRFSIQGRTVTVSKY